MTTLGIDIDDTILDLLGIWVEWYNNDFNQSLLPSDITTDWRIDQFVVPEAKEKIYNYIRYPQIFEYAKPIAGALDAINYLRSKGYKIVYITANDPCNAKEKWLIKYGFAEDEKSFICAYDKSLISVDFLIDDKFENVRDTQGIGILFNQPHNAKYDWDLRANNWQEVVDIIEGKVFAK